MNLQERRSSYIHTGEIRPVTEASATLCEWLKQAALSDGMLDARGHLVRPLLYGFTTEQIHGSPLRLVSLAMGDGKNYGSNEKSMTGQEGAPAIAEAGASGSRAPIKPQAVSQPSTAQALSGTIRVAEGSVDEGSNNGNTNGESDHLAVTDRKWFEGLGNKLVDQSQYYALVGLTTKQHAAYSLKKEYNLSLAEVARRMGIDRKTAQDHIDAAEKKITHNFENRRRPSGRVRTTDPRD